MIIELFKDYIRLVLQLILEFIWELLRYTLPSLLIIILDYWDGCGRGNGVSFENYSDDFLCCFKANDSNS